MVFSIPAVSPGRIENESQRQRTRIPCTRHVRPILGTRQWWSSLSLSLHFASLCWPGRGKIKAACPRPERRSWWKLKQPKCVALSPLQFQVPASTVTTRFSLLVIIYILASWTCSSYGYSFLGRPPPPCMPRVLIVSVAANSAAYACFRSMRHVEQVFCYSGCS